MDQATTLGFLLPLTVSLAAIGSGLGLGKAVGMAMEAMGRQPDPRMVQEPRHNPYIFWKEDEVEGGWERDINEFRKHHLR